MEGCGGKGKNEARGAAEGGNVLSSGRWYRTHGKSVIQAVGLGSL